MFIKDTVHHGRGGIAAGVHPWHQHLVAWLGISWQIRKQRKTRSGVSLYS